MHTFTARMSGFFVLVVALAAVAFFTREGFIAYRIIGGADTTVVFVGDVMLARDVEQHILYNGKQYPLGNITVFHKDYDFVVGNFEASVPKKHVQTPSGSFQFSVAESIVPILRDAGFTHMSLANNHTDDYGKEGYENTKKVLEENGVTPFGSPTEITSEEVVILDGGDTKIAVIPLYAVVSFPSLADVKAVVAEYSEKTDLQIVYIHWGEEYRLTSTASQKEYAHSLVDAGVDIVIGHHPHVVEEVEYYNGAAIFYSLGNYVFDQYWNDDVTTGLALALTADRKKVEVKLEPVRILRGSVRMLANEVQADILRDLAKRSPSASTDVARGTISIESSRFAGNE